MRANTPSQCGFLLLFLILVGAALPTRAFGQELVGSRLFGTVTDATGAVLPGAEVRIIQPSTGFVRSLVTGEEGTYVARQILAGTYNIEVSLPGFKMVTVVGLVIRVNESVRQDIRLEVGEVSTNVEVAGEPSLVNTYTAELAQTVDQRRIVDLPLNARDVTSLSMLAPGATDPVVTPFYAGSSGFVATAPSVNGSRIQDNSYYLDGLSNLYSQRLSANLYPNPDAIQEFTINTGQYSAEFGGRPGGQLSARTKSGTNELHGTLFEFARNPVFNARRWEDTRGLNDGLKRHQWGWAIGGPVYIPRIFDGRNKLFWFTSFQAIPLRLRGLPGFVESWTAREKAGDFSEHLTGKRKQVPSPACDGTTLAADTGAIFDPRTANPKCGSKGFPFPGNIIPSQLFDPVAVNFLTKHTPTSTALGQLHPFFVPQASDEYQFLQRVDWSMDNHSLMFRYLKGRNKGSRKNDPKNLLWSGSVGGIGSTDSRAESFGVTETWTPSPNTVITGGFVYIRNPWSRVPHSNLIGLDDWGSRLTSDPECRTINSISVQGRANIFITDKCGVRQNWNWEANVSATWIKGKHEIAFGGTYGRWGVEDPLLSGKKEFGAFNFSGGFTGISAADFLIGRAETFSVRDPGTVFKIFRHVGSWYVQDNIQVNRRLTLNLGLRWEPFSGPQRADSPNVSWVFPGRRSERFVNAPPGILYGGDPGTPGRENFFRRYNHFAPRVGFALDPTGSGKWAIRGGVGQYFGIIGGGQSLEAAGGFSPPMGGSQVVIVNPPSMVWPWDAPPYNGKEGIPLPAPTSQSRVPTPFGGFMYDPYMKGPNTWHWNFTVERKVTLNLLARASYVGTRGVHLQDGFNYNLARYIPGASSVANIQQRRPDPNFTAFHITGGFGDSWYNALQLTVEQRYSHSLSLLATYTFSKSIDTNSASIGWAGGFGTQDPRGPTFNKGLSDFDRTHIFNLAPIWDLPQLSGENPVVRAIFGGWQTSAIIQMRSGHAITPTASGAISLAGPFVGGQRADVVSGVDRRVGEGDRPGYKTKGYFNKAAFATPPEGTFGNAGRGAMRSPGYANVDFMIGKLISLAEEVKLQFRSEYFNLFNRVNLADPILDVRNQNFGRILGTSADPRILQFGLKLMF